MDSHKFICSTSHDKKRKKIVYKNNKINYKTSKHTKWKPISSENYTRICKIGEGTYGAVYKSQAPSGEFVAMKKIRLKKEKDGFPITAIREIKFLKALNHPNVVPLLDVVTSVNEVSSYEIFMVFEYLDHDLSGIMGSSEISLKEKHIKYYMKNILEGLYYIHDVCNLLHRDIKGSNLLINYKGDVKIGDFGLSRQYYEKDKNFEYTNSVVTLWYRSPELLLGDKHYTKAIDMWSVACVFSELIFGKPAFPGETEIQQLILICKLVGSPKEETFKNIKDMPIKLTKNYPRTIDKRYEKLKKQSPLAFDLLDKLLVLDPIKRLTAKQALTHEYFVSDPLPEKPELSKIKSSHEYEIRVRGKRKNINK